METRNVKFAFLVKIGIDDSYELAYPIEDDPDGIKHKILRYMNMQQSDTVQYVDAAKGLIIVESRNLDSAVNMLQNLVERYEKLLNATEHLNELFDMQLALPAPEKTVSLYVTKIPGHSEYKKMTIIKAIRGVSDFGLKEAKDIVDKADESSVFVCKIFEADKSKLISESFYYLLNVKVRNHTGYEFSFVNN